MTDLEVQAFLREGTRTARVATTRADGAPHVMPVWYGLDGDDLIFITGGNSVKGRNLRRDSRVSIVVDDDRPPFAFVQIRGEARLSEDVDDLFRYGVEINRRYVVEEEARGMAKRNAMPGELLVRAPLRNVVAITDIP